MGKYTAGFDNAPLRLGGIESDKLVFMDEAHHLPFREGVCAAMGAAQGAAVGVVETTRRLEKNDIACAQGLAVAHIRRLFVGEKRHAVPQQEHGVDGGVETSLLQRVQRETVLHIEGARSKAAKSLYMGGTAQRGSYIASDGADIGSFRDGKTHVPIDARSVVVGLEAKKGCLVDFDITRFELHDIAGTRRLVRFDAAALDGGIRRRKLLVLADEPGNVLLCKRAVANALGNRGVRIGSPSASSVSVATPNAMRTS